MAELEVLGRDATVTVGSDSGHHVMVDQLETLVDLLRQHIADCDVQRSCHEPGLGRARDTAP